MKLELLVEITQTWMKEARNCYAESINMSNQDFVKMMFVNGCFIVEFLILTLKLHHYFCIIKKIMKIDFYLRVE